MGGRSGPVGTILAVVFALPFVAIGAFVVWAAFSGQVTGGGSGGRVISGVVGVVFLGAGCRQIWQSVRASRSVESLAAPQGASPILGSPTQLATDYRSPGRQAQSAREVYGPLLEVAPLPKVKTSQGRALAVALGVAPAQGSLFLFLFGLAWTAMTLPFFVGLLVERHWAPAAFLSIFVLVGVGLLFSVIRKFLSRLKLPQVEISEEPVHLGDEITVHVEQRGPARVTRLRIDLLCREHAKYTVGTTTRTEDHEAYQQDLLDEPGKKLGIGERWPHEVRVTLPAGAPHSFAAPNNSIGWFVRVRAEIAGWPDYDELFELRALPRIPS